MSDWKNYQIENPSGKIELLEKIGEVCYRFEDSRVWQIGKYSIENSSLGPCYMLLDSSVRTCNGEIHFSVHLFETREELDWHTDIYSRRNKGEVFPMPCYPGKVWTAPILVSSCGDHECASWHDGPDDAHKRLSDDLKSKKYTALHKACDDFLSEVIGMARKIALEALHKQQVQDLRHFEHSFGSL